MRGVSTIPQLGSWRRLSKSAKEERRRDRREHGLCDPGTLSVIREGIVWIGTAQDRSRSDDGGVARDYSLLRGWSTSYPETTGYIVPTMLACATLRNEAGTFERAERMLEWLVSIQFPNGAFQGGVVDAMPRVPVTFNTGQILIGLAAGEAVLGEYREPLRRTADWLVETQDEDGCWRRYPSPFVCRGDKTYDTHIAWGLFEAARQVGDGKYGDSGLRNVRWALTHQQENGWFSQCCLDKPDQPLTHTLGYALRGVIEAYRYCEEADLLRAAQRTADALLGRLGQDGSLAGRFLADWTPAVKWACLTGIAQIASCWFLLYELTSEDKYLEAALRANRFVRRTVRVDALPEARGAVKGSFPVDGGYNPYQYLSGATKFVIDASLMENALEQRQRVGS